MRILNSLRAQLSVSLLIAALATAAALGYLTYKETLEQNKKIIDYQLRQTALSLRDQGMVDDWQREFLEDEKNDVVVKIWTKKGSALYTSHPEIPLPENAALGFANIQASGRQWRVYSMEGRGRIILVAQPYEIRHDLAADAALHSLRPLIAFVPLMALLIWAIVGRALKPLKRMEREVTSRGARSLHPVSEEGLPSEIAPLVQALNALLSKLKEAFAAQRAFVADAAHELRSPLTALKLQLHLMAIANDEAEKSSAMQKLNDGVDRASRLIEQLLTAARTEYSKTTYREERVDLAELMRRVFGEIYPLAENQRIDVGMEAPDHVHVHGDTVQLYILIRNLLDNAIRYTPLDGVVLASISEQNDSTCLTIDDSGPGIPVEERQRVFRRFYRGHNTTQSGNGLGLAIVKNIVDQHGGTIELRQSHLGGLQAHVCFPLRQGGKDSGDAVKRDGDVPVAPETKRAV